jgi:ribonucleoside-triphosphate reductase
MYNSKKSPNKRKVMAKCGAKCEVWSRPCGYFRPVESWNRGKKEEFKNRKVFKTPNQNKG